MKKLLGILVLGFLWCSNANATEGEGICGLQSNLAEMESYKLYLFANYGTNTVSKNLFDKSLDNDSAFDELLNFLN